MKDWIKRNWGLALWVSFLVVLGIAEMAARAQKPKPFDYGPSVEWSFTIPPGQWIEQHCRPVKDAIKCDK